MNKHVIKPAKCGAADSKYFSNPNQFDEDIEFNKHCKELFEIRVRQLLLEDPSKIKERYHETIDVLLWIKNEFGL